MKSAARPIFKALRSQRGFAAQAAAARSETGAAVTKHEPKVTRLPNGAIVASVESFSPISRVTLAFNAGSRAETGDNAGITHCLRNAANLTSKRSSGFATTRSVQQAGGSLTCSTSRDHMIYQLDASRPDLADLFPAVVGLAQAPEFHHWELSENVKYTNLDLAILEASPEIQLMEALHKAAFRAGLGNSLFMPQFAVGSHGGDMLHSFVNSHFTSDNMAVVGVGVDHDHLVNLAKSHIASGSGQSVISPSKYHGGELRVPTASPLVHGAVVTEGASLVSKDLFALGVLQHIMGAGPSIKYSSNMATSKVNQAGAQATQNPFSASCINVNYAESGLFGFHVIAQKNDIGSVMKAVAGQFAQATKGGVTDADVKRGKAQLKAAIHMTGECSGSLMEDVVSQVLISGQVLQAHDVDAAIDKITAADVNNVAKKVINGKPTMAVVGDLGHTPYLDEVMA